MKPIFEKTHKPDDHSFYIEEVVRPHFLDPWHFHPEIEILYIKNAYGTKYFGDIISLFNPGGLVVIGSDTPHVWISNSDYLNPEYKLMSSAIVILFLEDINGKSFSDFHKFHEIKQFLIDSKRGIQFSDKTCNLRIKHIERLTSMKGMSKLLGLFTILDIMSVSNDNRYLSAPNYKSLIINCKDKERMETIYQYVIQNYLKKISLDEVASLVNLTPQSFYRYFKSRTNKGFSSFVNEVRIGNSCKLLIP